MNTEYTPYLCGSTFFTLLLHAKKNRIALDPSHPSNSIKPRNGHIMCGLIKVFSDTYYTDPNDAMNTSTTRYKQGEFNGDVNIPFNDQMHLDAFNKLVRENYPEALRRMQNFTDTYLDLGKKDQLVRAILELYELDTTLNEDMAFWVSPSGNPVGLNAIKSAETFVLEPFLLGTFHFVLSNDRRNELGRDTLIAWGERKNQDGKTLHMINPGENVQKKLEVCTYQEAERKGNLNSAPRASTSKIARVLGLILFILKLLLPVALLGATVFLVIKITSGRTDYSPKPGLERVTKEDQILFYRALMDDNYEEAAATFDKCVHETKDLQTYLDYEVLLAVSTCEQAKNEEDQRLATTLANEALTYCSNTLKKVDSYTWPWHYHFAKAVQCNCYDVLGYTVDDEQWTKANIEIKVFVDMHPL